MYSGMSVHVEDRKFQVARCCLRAVTGDLESMRVMRLGRIAPKSCEKCTLNPGKLGGCSAIGETEKALTEDRPLSEIQAQAETQRARIAIKYQFTVRGLYGFSSLV